MKVHERMIYRETYSKAQARFDDCFLPELKHTNGVRPLEMHLLATGIVQRGTEQLEYHDVRLYFPRQES